MPTPKDDLDKISEVLLDFFDTKRIRLSLSVIHRLGISGWEKWWQTELAIYLAESESIAEWDMEHPFDTDRRKGLAQERMALDIGFRLKRHMKEEWHFVELKQDDDFKRCIDKMCRDADKVFAARNQSFDGLRIRYIACAGAFVTVKDKSSVIKYANEALDSIGLDADGLYLEAIRNHHSLLIF
jgi:hypothetical protein